MGENEYLLDSTLKSWRGKRVALAIGSEQSFTGILEDFDDEVVLLRDVSDIVQNRAKALLVKIDDINWIMLL